MKMTLVIVSKAMAILHLFLPMKELTFKFVVTDPDTTGSLPM